MEGRRSVDPGEVGGEEEGGGGCVGGSAGIFQEAEGFSWLRFSACRDACRPGFHAVRLKAHNKRF